MDNADKDLFVYSIVGILVAFALGIAIGAVIVFDEKRSSWDEYAADKCYPLAVDHADSSSFYFECAEAVK